MILITVRSYNGTELLAKKTATVQKRDQVSALRVLVADMWDLFPAATSVHSEVCDL